MGRRLTGRHAEARTTVRTELSRTRSSRGRQGLITLLIVAACVIADHASKRLARDTLAPLEVRVMGMIELHHVENPGLAYGLGARWPEPRRFWLLTVAVSVGATALLALLVYREPTPALLVGGALAAGGTLANAADRWSNGAVLDFVAIRALGFMSSIFNLADLVFTIGLLLVVMSVIGRIARRRPGASPAG